MVMKQIKGFSNNLLNRRASSENSSVNSDSPEASAARGVRLFCESAGPNNAGEEVLHLPVIVEAAESSPAAAAAAAKQIRKFLAKDNQSKPYVQYNAIMLIRILADNPGETFTRNMDDQFVKTVKDLLRNGRDPSVQQILRETLTALYTDKGYDTNMGLLFSMWNKEQGSARAPVPAGGPRTLNAPAWNPYGAPVPPSQQPREQFARNGRMPSGLPSAQEMAARVEEARTTAKLLLQLVQSTPHNELIGNDLVKEFADRCQTAQRSIQHYINCDNPPPDDDTLQTLIETNEQLSLASSKHQRAILQARRMNPSPSPATASGSPADEISSAPRPPPGPPPQSNVPNIAAPQPTRPSAGAPRLELPAIVPESTSNTSSVYSQSQAPPPPPTNLVSNMHRRQSEFDDLDSPPDRAELPAPNTTNTTGPRPQAPPVPQASGALNHSRTDSFPNYYSTSRTAGGGDPFADQDDDDDGYDMPPSPQQQRGQRASIGRKPVPEPQMQHPAMRGPNAPGMGADFGDGGSPVSPVEERERYPGGGVRGGASRERYRGSDW